MSKRNKILLQFAVLFFCLFAVGWTISKLGIEEVISIAMSADPVWLALSFLPLIARYLIWGLKWQWMMHRQGAVGLWTTLQALLAGCFVNLTTPTAKLAGGVLRAALIHKKTGWRMSLSYGWSMADQLTNTLGNTALFGVFAIIACTSLPSNSGRYSLLASGIATLLVIALWVASRPALWRQIQKPKLKAFLARWIPDRFQKSSQPDESQHWVIRIFGPVVGKGGAWDAAIPDLVLAALSFGALCVANAMVLKALGADAPFFPVATAVIMGYFAGTALGTMGGIGATELFLIQFYTLAGVPETIATAGALLHRASYYGITLLWGGFALITQSKLSSSNKSGSPTKPN